MGLVIADQAGRVSPTAIISISPKRHGITALAKDQPGERVSQFMTTFYLWRFPTALCNGVKGSLIENGRMLAWHQDVICIVVGRTGFYNLAILHCFDCFKMIPAYHSDINRIG